MKERLIQFFVAFLLKNISEESLRELTDKLLDFVEAKVKESKSEWDDALLLPLCDIVRRAFGIEEK